jgi:hypothetical protein
MFSGSPIELKIDTRIKYHYFLGCLKGRYAAPA